MTANTEDNDRRGKAKTMTIQTNEYGNVDVRRGVPTGLRHVSGQRLSVTCKAVGIEFAPALVGWKRRCGSHRPVFDGVVVIDGDEARLREAIAKRNARRLTPAQKAKRRQKQHAEDAVAFGERIRTRFPRMPGDDVWQCAYHTTEIGSGRVGRSTCAEDPVLAAVVAYARHRYTDYDKLFERLDWEFDDKDDIRTAVNGQVREVVAAWEAGGSDAPGVDASPQGRSRASAKSLEQSSEEECA